MIAIEGDLEAPEQGLDIGIGITPKAGTWFADLAAALKASGQGVPTINNPGAMLQMQVDADWSQLEEPLTEFTEFIGAFAAKSSDDARPTHRSDEGLLEGDR